MSFEKNLSQNDLTALWAALAAMVKDVHAPQDNLTEEQWAAASALWSRLDGEVNRRATLEQQKRDLIELIARGEVVDLTKVPPGSICLAVEEDGAPICVWPLTDGEGDSCSYGFEGPMWAASPEWKVQVIHTGGLSHEQCAWVMWHDGYMTTDMHVSLVRRKLAHLAAGGTIESFDASAST